ncbi:MAG: alpha/beta fold hydrolase [Alphaproteobacteria bacterium]
MPSEPSMSGDLAGPTSHSYFSHGLRLHYVDWGNDGAPPLLLVHGGRDHCRNWDWVARALRGEYHVIAPDLRGHGDSQWALGGGYGLSEYVYDIAQLLHQTDLVPATIIAHSMGGIVSLLYAGLYPEKVKNLVVIEGLGWSPSVVAKRAAKPGHERFAEWIEELRGLAGRTPRRYPSIEDAYSRMQGENPHLSPERARHLTVHGVNRNEDGTFSWKFDNYVRAFAPHGISAEETQRLWARVACPTLLVRGSESWASDPAKDGRAAHFKNARIATIEGAGHWSHHDRLDEFLRLVREFLAA